MNSLARSVAAVPLAGRTTVRWYGQGGIAAAATAGAGGMMASQTPSRVSLPSACSCGGPLPSQLLPLQTRRGAARSSGKRSPTVRRAQAGGSRSGGGASLGPSGTNTSSVFPEDPATLLVALKAGIDTLGSSLTQEECLAVIADAQRLEHGKMAVNEAALLRDYNLTPYKLHTAGVLLLFGASNFQDSTQCFMLATSLLHLAATVGSGYMPSVLTIMNLFGIDTHMSQQQAAHASRMRQSRVYQSAEQKFLAYLAKANASGSPAPTADTGNPDALVNKANAFTLAGLLAESTGHTARALRWFQAARVVGQDIGSSVAVDGETADILPRDPKWDWERKCLEAIGSLQVGAADAANRQEAREALRTAALALNSGKACMLLATKYAYDAERNEAQEKELDAILQRAAIAGEPGASEVLAEREVIEADAPGASKDEAAFHGMLADEWRRIADASAATESVRRG